DNVGLMREKAKNLAVLASRSSAFRFAFVFTLIFLLLVLRRPDAITNPQFWAEDGPVFYYGQITSSSWTVLFQPSAGYLQLLPRMVAALAALFPVGSVPLVFNLCAIGISALCCSLFSLNQYRYLLEPDGLRITLCLVIATAFQADELIATNT